MKSKHRTARSGLRAVGIAIDVVAMVSGEPYVSPSGWRSVIVMMAIAMIGVAIWFGTVILSVIIVAVFGLGEGPYASLGGALALAGFFGGLAAAAIVMFRIIRRHRRIVTLSGFDDELDDDGDAPIPVAAEVSRRGISPNQLRALDARLGEESRPPVASPAPDDGPPGRKDDDSYRT